MPATHAENIFASGTSDISDLPFDIDFDIDNAEYGQIMRRISIAEGDTATPVSAFNSAI